MKYDYLIVGAGLFGATFNEVAKRHGKSTIIVEANKVGGACYTEWDNDILIHKYGAHIFHTDDKRIWKYINNFGSFHNYINSPIANYKGKLYNLPFNMNTFYEMWGLSDPKAVKSKIEKQVKEARIDNPNLNLENKAISLVGKDIYETLIKGYTEKQWGKQCINLPAEIINRLPVRFIFDNNYFNDEYQGIPNNGYSSIISNMIGDTEVVYDDFLNNKEKYKSIANTVIYTGRIDRYFDYQLGMLEYRGVEFDDKWYSTSNVQGTAVMNYTDVTPEYTRSIEHRHFMKNCKSSKSIVSYEYPMSKVNKNNALSRSYYPVNNDKNNLLYKKYRELDSGNVIFAGRQGDYKYYDMDDTIVKAFLLYDHLDIYNVN